MNLYVAESIARSLIDRMQPYCVRVEIAGSIRRHKFFDIKDVEIVAIPKWETSGSGLFVDESRKLNRLLQWAFDAEALGDLQWIKPGTSEILPWEPKADGKYWRGLLSQGVKLDLFIAGPANFGLIFLIRTGSAEFSEAVVTHGKHIGKRCVGGYLQTAGGDIIETPEEQDVFDVLNLAYVEPSQRTGREALRGRRL